MGKTGDTYLKEIVITPEDLKELEDVHHGSSVNNHLDRTSLKVFDFAKQRKLTTAMLIEVKLGMNKRTAHIALRKLERVGLLKCEMMNIKSTDGVGHPTCVYFVVEKDEKKKK